MLFQFTSRGEEYLISAYNYQNYLLYRIPDIMPLRSFSQIALFEKA